MTAPASVPGSDDPVGFIRERAAELVTLLDHLHASRPELKTVPGVALAVGFLKGATANLEDELKQVRP